MEFGLVLPNFGGRISIEGIKRVTKEAESSGFDSLWVTDHIIMPMVMSEPYGTPLEPFMTLSFLSSITERVKLGTSVLVLPQRNPILAAKQAATLDVLSNGRMILDVGSGWVESEFKYLGYNFKDSGMVLDEGSRLMRELWSKDQINFDGEFFKVDGAILSPKPINKAVPIWIGGNSNRAVRRVLNLGDGWHPVGIDPDTFRHGAGIFSKSKSNITLSLRIAVDLRKRREIYISPSGERKVAISDDREKILNEIEEYEEAGLDHLIASILHKDADEIIGSYK